MRETLTLALVIGLGCCIIAWCAWFGLYSPKSDVAQIKTIFWSLGRRVMDVRRYNTQFGGRQGPSYRIYEVFVSASESEPVRYIVGVEPALARVPSLVEWRDARWHDLKA